MEAWSETELKRAKYAIDAHWEMYKYPMDGEPSEAFKAMARAYIHENRAAIILDGLLELRRRLTAKISAGREWIEFAKEHPMLYGDSAREAIAAHEAVVDLEAKEAAKLDEFIRRLETAVLPEEVAQYFPEVLA